MARAGGGGVWSPSNSIAYGVAVHTFSPTLSLLSEQRESSIAEPPNPYQVPLEVGDEVYVFEVFRPRSASSSTEREVWYRGYVVSTSPYPRITNSSDVYSFPSAANVSGESEEPQVSVGIFPASHVQIREQLEDSERRLSGLQNGEEHVSVLTSLRDASGRMAPLQEEDEEPYSPNLPHMKKSSSSNGISPKHRNRTSVGSVSNFGSQLSNEQQLSLHSNRFTPVAEQKPAPPLPNLKCGDETASGAEEPLIDEIACALREWSSLLYTHLYRRNYALFNQVKDHIEVLHTGRRQLLAHTLNQEETEKLRKVCVARLVQGNVEQGLDVIVRHPKSGGLVDIDAEFNLNDDQNLWISVIRMYAMQVTLAYPGLYPESSIDVSLPSLSHVKDRASMIPTRRVVSTRSRNSSILSLPSDDSLDSFTGAKFFHVLLDVRSVASNICAAGETLELYFSLFNKADGCHLSEEFCLILNHHGFPARDESNMSKMKTLFRDLSQHDIHEDIYLVCRIVKNGHFKVIPQANMPPSNSSGSVSGREREASIHETQSFDSSGSLAVGEFNFPSSGGMLTTDRQGNQSYRRPFGCAVLEISQFSHTPFDPMSPLPTQEFQMAIFVPVSESSFASIHEDIIASKIKEFEKSPRADHIAVGIKVLYGNAQTLVKDHPDLFGGASNTFRLGFPDVTFPSDQRNEVYLKLWSGEFGSSSSLQRSGRGLAQLAAAATSGGKNLEVTVEIRMKDGSLVERVLSRGNREGNITQFSSTVFKANNNPTWGELVKLDIPMEIMTDCHLFFTVRARPANTRGSGSSSGERPFAFGYLPLFLDNSAFVPDGTHALVLYRYDRVCATPQFYFQVPPTIQNGQIPPLPPAALKTIFPLKDTISIRTFLVSTRYTQNETLLKLLNWEETIGNDSEALKEVLVKLKFCGEVEVCKFLRGIFDSLFGILVSRSNQSGEMDDLVFQALVTILGIVSDRRFTNFKPVLEVYIERHFSCTTASHHMIKSMERLLQQTRSPEAGTSLRASIKVWHHLFKFIVRSREMQRAKDIGSGVTSDHLETTFKRELTALLNQVGSMMRITTPSSIIGTQTLAVQHFPSILGDLAKCYNDQELSDIVISFVESISAQKGKIIIWKTLLLNQVVRSPVFTSPAGRAALVPNIVRWIKPSMGRFDEHMMCSPKDPQTARDNARVTWMESIRLGTGVIASMLDIIQEALVKPAIKSNRSLLAQEQDNIEYLLGLFPRLLDSYKELQNTTNLEVIERQRSQASVIANAPPIFPSTYPFALLSKPPPHSSQASLEDGMPRGSLQAGIGELACLFIALLLLAPRKIFEGWLEATYEVEGKDNFSRLLTQIFRVSKSILANDAYPHQWLNINILAHRVILKMIGPIAALLERDFIPLQQASFTFNTLLWQDFFTMLLRLLSSPALLIEEFSPQKRRAVWRLAGDIRGEGAKILTRLWNAIGWPDSQFDEPAGAKGRHGGYQVQFVPGLVEDVLSLCLSHHDELRTSAVHVLYSMIVSEYYLNEDFSLIQAEVIDRLDKLFMSHTKGDEISRAFFIGQLRTLFDEAKIEDKLRKQVDAFLASVNSFLDLLLAVRNLPEGEEYQEDRIISTLKLMSFIRGIGRSEIFIRYVQRLVSYHEAMGNETEAGLTLKLHADLHDWNLNVFVEAQSELGLPRQTEFARKETLYMRMLAHLSKGKAWEAAIEICKELQMQYEAISFNYTRLSELLMLQSELYSSIINSKRMFGKYYRVAFYGARFPISVCGKQFIYRGGEGEKQEMFVEKMLNKHPGAILLNTNHLPPEELQYADGQFLQITPVVPEPDRESPVFTNPDVPQAIREYYEHNATQTFSFSRSVNKDPTGRLRVANDFVSLWTEKTVFISEDLFPTVLRRSEVVELRIIDVSPIENALSDVEKKTRELVAMERRYHGLAQTEPDRSQINTTPLSMTLNSIVDAPANQGVPMYRRAFFGPDFVASNPDRVVIVQKLQYAIDSLVLTMVRCMKLHGFLAPEPMQPFHATLEKFLEKNFADELSRIPPEVFESEVVPGWSQHNNAAIVAQNNEFRSESISITNSRSSGGLGRQDSTSTVRSSATITPSTSSANRSAPTNTQVMASTTANMSGFHIPPLESLGSNNSRTPSFYTTRSLDVVAENNNSTSQNIETSAQSSGSVKSVGPERKSSVLGLKWKRKGTSQNQMASIPSENEG